MTGHDLIYLFLHLLMELLLLIFNCINNVELNLNDTCFVHLYWRVYLRSWVYPSSTLLDIAKWFFNIFVATTLPTKSFAISYFFCILTSIWYSQLFQFSVFKCRECCLIAVFICNSLITSGVEQMFIYRLFVLSLLWIAGS